MKVECNNKLIEIESTIETCIGAFVDWYIQSYPWLTPTKNNNWISEFVSLKTEITQKCICYSNAHRSVSWQMQMYFQLVKVNVGFFIIKLIEKLEKGLGFIPTCCQLSS